MLDIDGTICAQTPPGGNYFITTPYRDRIEKVNKLYDDGDRIIYWTARGMSRFKGDSEKCHEEFYDLTKAQLEGWGVKFHELKLGKPVYDLWVDDKAIHDEDFFASEDFALEYPSLAAKIKGEYGKA